MKFYKNLHLALTLLLCLVLCFSQSLCISASQIDTNASASLTLTFAPNDTPAANVTYRLYCVADMSSAAEFTYTPKFAAYPIAAIGDTAENWRMLAETLQGFIALDSIAPDYTAVTNADGTFSLSGIPTGLYLLTGDLFIHNNTVYIPQPFLLSLPSQSGGAWNYNVQIGAKYTERPADREISVNVLKVWYETEENPRAISATVALLADNTLYDTVVLDQTNNWRHTWSDLSPTILWTVCEIDIPTGYIVQIGRENGLYGVNNIVPHDDDDPPDPTDPTTPTEPSEPSEPTAPTEPSEPSEPTNPTEPSEPNYPPHSTPPTTPTQPTPPDKPEIPNTGVLWWPVPVMVLCGLACLLVGISRRRGKQDEK